MEPEPTQRCHRGCCDSQAEHYRSLVVSSGTLSAETADVTRREKQLDLDRDAYKRMRRDGVQPASVDGSADLEKRALDQVEIDFKKPIPKKDLAQVKEIVAEMKQGQATKDYAW